MTPKQKRFVEEYLVDLNATQAAIRAGYSEKTAKQVGHENLTKPDLQAAIADLMEARSERTQITQDRVLQELALLAFSNMEDYAGWGPNGVRLKNSDALTRAIKAAVVEVSETRSEKSKTIKFKLADKKGALDSAMRHLGLFNDKLEQTGNVVFELNFGNARSKS